MDAVASPEQRFLAYARDRDAAVLEPLLREHADRAFQLARRLLGRGDAAEDAVQEACVRLIGSAGSYRAEIPFAAWFGRLVHLAAVDQRRHRARHQRSIAKAARLAPKTTSEPPADETLLAQLRDALATLPETYRAPLALHYLGGLDGESVARALGLRPGTLRVRLSRGLDRLREQLGRLGVECSAAALPPLLSGFPAAAAPPALHLALAKLAAAGVAPLLVGGVAIGKLAIIVGSVAAASLVSVAVVRATERPRKVPVVESAPVTVAAPVIPETPVAPAKPVTPVAPVTPPAPMPAAASATRLLAEAAAGTWIVAPDTHLESVAVDRDSHPGLQATNGVRSVISSWNGAALDTRRERLVVWGGGATNYWGNEIYTFDIETLRWERCTEPTPDPVNDLAEANADGTPKSRATYGGVAYLAHVDALFVAGGCFGPSPGSPVARDAWTFDFATKRWRDRGLSTPPIGGGYGCGCAYDAATRTVWFVSHSTSGAGGLWSYEEATDAWTKRSDDDLADRTLVLDPRLGLLIGVGCGEVFAYDVKGGDFTRRVWTTSGGEALVAARAPGLDYDPVADRLVGWSGGSVLSLDPETERWTATDAAGAPTPTATGIYGRWRYVPRLDAFVVVTASDDDVYFWKPMR